MKSIFVSYVFEDLKYVNRIKKWKEKGQLTGFNVIFEEKDLRIHGKEAVKKHLRQKVRGAAIVLILIGNDTHNHDWITWEVELANSFHKEICCMRIPETTGAAPWILRNHKIRAFHPNQITTNY